MTVAAYLAKFLKEKQVKHIFGFQGSAMLKMLDEIMETGCIQYIQGFHEQAASFAADAYARVSGRIGVTIATSGPGAVNIIGGIVDSYFDSVPTLFITGQDYSGNVIGNTVYRQNGFQDLDIVSMVKKVTKYSVCLDQPENIAYELEKAEYLATNGRKGPVLIDIPIDIQFAQIDEAELPHYEPELQPLSCYDGKYDEVIQMLREAQRPLILVGGGIRLSGGCAEVNKLKDCLNIPAVTTLNGLDGIDGAYGFSGLHGHTYANIALYNADLVLALGTRFGQRQVGKKAELYTNAAVIHVDIDQNELGRSVPERLSIHADVRDWLEEFNKKILTCNLPDYTVWNNTLNELKLREFTCTEVNHLGLDPIHVIRRISEAAPAPSVLTGDVGQNQMWLSQGVSKKEGMRIFSSSGYGSMGFSLPASIGAYYADEKATVFAISGDGGIQMNIQELQLLSIRQINIKVIVFNNQNLGMMRETQKRYYNSHFYGNNPNEFSCVDLKALSLAYHLQYIRIEKEKDLDMLPEIMDDKRPYLVECVIQMDSMLINRYDEYDRIGNLHL